MINSSKWYIDFSIFIAVNCLINQYYLIYLLAIINLIFFNYQIKAFNLTLSLDYYDDRFHLIDSM